MYGSKYSAVQVRILSMYWSVILWWNGAIMRNSFSTIAGIAIGVAAMVVVLSVINGFEKFCVPKATVPQPEKESGLNSHFNWLVYSWFLFFQL